MAPPYGTIGSALHVVNLVNIAVYGSTLYLYGYDPSAGVFDETWLQDGFCLPHGDRPYLTTHDLSGYTMVVFALLGLGIQQYLGRNTVSSHKEQLGLNLDRADRLTFWALVGALGHAAGHFLISNGKRMKYYPPPDERFIDDLRKSTVLVALAKAGPGYPLFWIPLVKTYMMNTAQGRVAGLAFLVNVLSLFVPAKFGFSYTQAVLFGGMSIDQIMLPQKEKDTFEFALWPLLTTIPNGIFAWVECLTCTTSPLMKQHGHIIYDVYMVSSYILFYLVCWVREKRRSESSSPKQKAL